MTLALGIFDVFTYLIPGAFHLALLTYVSTRLGWFDIDSTKNLNATLLVLAVALVCYLLGHATYGLGLGKLAGRAARMNLNSATSSARQLFTERVPNAKGRAFVQADPYILLSAIEVKSNDSAIEVSRMRALGLMLRESAAALILAAAVAVVEFFASANRDMAGALFLLFVLAAIGALRQGKKLVLWANTKTLEVAFWIPEVDERFGGSSIPDDGLGKQP
jgi:hypothetical protein